METINIKKSLNPADNIDESVSEKEICPKCGSADYNKAGIVKNKRLGKIQRVRCRNCKKYFTLRIRIVKNRNFEARIINLAIHLSYFNLKAPLIEKILLKYIGIKVSRQTIFKWIKEFGNPSYKKAWKQITEQINDEAEEKEIM